MALRQNGNFENSNGTHGVNDEQKEYPKSMAEGNQLSILMEWLNDMTPSLRLPLEPSEEEFRACLTDGIVLCRILNKLCPGLIDMGASFEPGPAKVNQFLAAMDELGLPSFEASELEQGYMKPVLQCLRTLRASFNSYDAEDNIHNHSRKRWSVARVDLIKETGHLRGSVRTYGKSSAIKEDSQLNSLDGKFQIGLHGPITEDISDMKISELINSRSLDNASTKSLFGFVNQILDERIEKRNGDVPQNLACLLREVVLLIERRMATQAHHLKNQNNLYRACEEKYQSRIRVLETLARGSTEENKVLVSQFERLKAEKTKLEEKEKLEEQNVLRLKKEKDHSSIEISTLKQELEMAKRTHMMHCLKLEAQFEETKVESEKKLKELGCLLIDSKKKVKELESFSESKSQRWKKKESTYQNFMDYQFAAIQDLRVAFQFIKHEVLKTKRSYAEEFNHLGLNLKGLADAAENYHSVLAENRKLYNEVQDLKGNIRVYCRIRPFLPGQSKKQTIFEYIGENGELVVSNPIKQGKDSHRLFKFNKVFGPEATQEEVFLDAQPLIRSVLDGYNVCVFAYGQTGSGKTYTMSGPCISSGEDWGVNYRALNDLFQITQSRKNCIIYDVGVQMVEIYNEQVRDLLSSDGPQKRLGIWSTTQPNGLAIPEASMHSVKSTTNVLELMNIGLMNRAVGATALNERSSRSHSVLTVHVHGTDVKSGATLRGNLHLIDLAGSERVDRSEATGDRLKEAQHINRSLSALGDVIFALAQKSAHVPYRNSKLTQVLQSSLGGQAKTLMFVQLNPDSDSYSETISTLKFAERVSGVELGAARSSRVGRDVRELMEQISSLKETIAKKDEDIEHMRVKANIANSANQVRKVLGETDKAASDMDNCSDFSDKHSDAGSHHSVEDFKNQKISPSQSKSAVGDSSQNVTEDFELLGFGEADSEERLSDISDGGLSMGTETDGSSSVVEFTLFPETAKPAERSENTEKAGYPSKLPKPLPKVVKSRSSHLSLPKATKAPSSKILSSARKPTPTSSTRFPKRRQ
ncbi:kinesin-like protein KIN-14J isoform X2 [Mangifera indica]|uniref:kinesin-like protein KIN-14J isoform X2 n=1 Tax=Mangifera indica TaxID=29780 RepID=UPI001CFAB869|nr:kinesin-like protein KIN-14J isoform X2 [Mangifera indica]